MRTRKGVFFVDGLPKGVIKKVISKSNISSYATLRFISYTNIKEAIEEDNKEKRKYTVL